MNNFTYGITLIAINALVPLILGIVSAHNLKTQNSSIRNELAHVADLAGALGSGVRSGDSNLSDAWFSVRDSVSKFYGRFSDLETSYDTEISKYIEETIALEMNAALNVEAVSEEINDISSQLDSLFGM
jgi:hypothetical protein